jgi:hypothetical protein
MRGGVGWAYLSTAKTWLPLADSVFFQLGLISLMVTAALDL